MSNLVRIGARLEEAPVKSGRGSLVSYGNSSHGGVTTLFPYP